MELIIVLSVIFAIVYTCIIPAEFADIARKKGYSYGKYWWYTFLFNIVGILLVMALPQKELDPREKEKMYKKRNFHCSSCNARIEYGLDECPDCGRKLDWSNIK